MEDFNTLVLSGGGIKGLQMLGSLELLSEEGYLDSIKKYIGVSIGVIINLFLILGFQPKKVISFFIKNDYLQKISIEPLYGLLGKGFINFDKITALVQDYIYSKLDYIPTISQLCEEFKLDDFIAVTYNFDQNKEVVISKETFPDMCILTAIRCTCNIPFIFDIFTYNNDRYFDGFLTNNLPINLVNFEKGDIPLIINLGDDLVEEAKGEKISKLALFWSVLLIPLKELQKHKFEKNINKVHIFHIKTNNLLELDYILTMTKILNSFSDGYLQMRKQINKKKTCVSIKDKITTQSINK